MDGVALRELVESESLPQAQLLPPGAVLPDDLLETKNKVMRRARRPAAEVRFILDLQPSQAIFK
ncbi:MAG: hypothetical protein ACRD1N_06440, partial [Terriglobia bacterium]